MLEYAGDTLQDMTNIFEKQDEGVMEINMMRILGKAETLKITV